MLFLPLLLILLLRCAPALIEAQSQPEDEYRPKG